MLASWHALLPEYMSKWNVQRSDVRSALFIHEMFSLNIESREFFSTSNRFHTCTRCPQLVELFGRTRDEWMAADLDGWLAPNRIYPGVADCMRALMYEHEVYIVTTKQARFTETILRQMAGIEFPMERIFSQTVSGRPKSEVLQNLQSLHPNVESYHFVEDKLSTLEKVCYYDKLLSAQFCHKCKACCLRIPLPLPLPRRYQK
jgi:hypothetical protein